MSESLTLEEHDYALTREETQRRAYESILLEYRIASDKQPVLEKAQGYLSTNEGSLDAGIQGRLNAYEQFLQEAKEGKVE